MESTSTPAAEMGPIPPPSFVNGSKVEDPSESELKASIKKRGANSYYYAHNYEG